MNKTETLTLIDELKSGLLSKATGGDLAEPEYTRMRNSILAIPEIRDHIPLMIKSNRSAQDFSVTCRQEIKPIREEEQSSMMR